MTRTRATVALCGLWAAVGALSRPLEPPPAAGVVVERVKPGWPAEAAGVQPGDVLLSWSRAPNPPANPSGAQGDFAAPFEIPYVEIEQSPRGNVEVLGLREDRRLTFDLPPQGWGIVARPPLPGPVLATYLQGSRRIEAGDSGRGLELWRGAAARLSKAGRHADAAWLHSRVAEAAARRNEGKAARQAFALAIREAGSGDDWWLRASLHLSYAEELLRGNEPARATEEIRKALNLVESRAPESLSLAWILERLAALDEYRNDLPRARDLQGRALALRQRNAPDSVAVAASLDALGRLSTETEPAEDLYERSLAIWERAAPESLGTARVLSDLGELQFQRGDLLVAEALHQRAYAIRRKLDPGGLDLASSCHWLGNVAWRRGHLASAEDFHRRALAIRRSLAPDSEAVETSLNSLGNVAGTRKDLKSAERLHRQALAIGEKVDPDRVEAILHNLGEDARLQGDFAGADAFLRRALAMHERRPPGSGRSIAIANALVSLAAVARDRGDLAEAENLIRQALAIRQTYEPDTLHLAEDREVLADVLRARGRLAEARDVYAQILDVASRVSPGSELEARSLHGLGAIDRKEGRTEQAAALYRRSIDALEAQKRRLGGPTEAQELFAAAYADYYRESVETLVALKNDRDAFSVLERSHARLLLAMLAERDLALTSDVPKALEIERRQADAAYDKAQNELLAIPAKEASSPRRQELLDRLAAIRTRRGEIVDGITKASPRYASLRYPRPLDLAATRASLDPGTLVLAYSIGREAAFLFAVEPANATGPGLTVHTLASDGTALRASIDTYRRLLRFRAPPGSDPRKSLDERARSLYDILVKPAESLVGSYERVLILPDGPLHTLPFGALVRGLPGGRSQYLVEWKPVHTAISATVYAELKKTRADAPRDPAIVIAAFGDPKYPPPDRKSTGRRGDVEPEVEADALDGVDDPRLRSIERSGFRFQPLPASRKEVEEIASLYAPRSAAYLGADATEERARSIGRDVPLIHYACHAIINELFPLDSALAFTIPDDPAEGQDNGLLQAWEIFEKVRIDADLVTLSACDSGLGKEMGGEGLIGLTRAFQYAGARSVLASLWKVDDASTGDLMKRFYQYLKSGKPKDEALRLAQIDLIRSPGYSQPKDWAAFQLNGDWMFQAPVAVPGGIVTLVEPAEVAPAASSPTARLPSRTSPASSVVSADR